MSAARGGAVTLTEFLLARIAEDEREAVERRSLQTPHLLAECEAKRRIAARISTNPDGFPWHVAVLAEVYDDHADYREEWRP